MYVKLSHAEIDELLGYVSLAEDVDSTPLLEKLRVAKALAPAVGDSFIDPDSNAMMLLMASAGVRASVVVPIDIVDAGNGDDQPKQDKQDWPSTRPSFLNTPFGWEQQGEKLVANKKEQDVIKAALKDQKKDWTFQQIADDLNGRHLRTRKNSRWTAQTVRHLLTKSVKHKQNKALLAQFGR